MVVHRVVLRFLWLMVSPVLMVIMAVVLPVLLVIVVAVLAVCVAIAGIGMVEYYFLRGWWKGWSGKK